MMMNCQSNLLTIHKVQKMKLVTLNLQLVSIMITKNLILMNFMKWQQKFYEQSKSNVRNLNSLKLSLRKYESKMKVIQEFSIRMRKELNIKLNIQRDIFQLAIDCKSMLFQHLDFGDNFSIFLSDRFSIFWIIHLKSILKNRYLHLRLEKSLLEWNKFVVVIQIIGMLLIMLLKSPIQQKVNTFSQKLGQRPIKVLPTVESILKQPVDRSANYYQNVWENENFKNLLMRTRDYFEKGSQNDDSQIWNGFGIQQIQQFFLRVEYLKYLQTKEAQWIVHRFKLDKFKRFKLKFIKPPYELIIFCKLVYWDINIHSVDTIFKIQNLKLEIKALNLALEILVEENSKFTDKIEVLEKQLYDKSLGYHEYFALIYRLERLRIFSYNINLINIMIIVIDKIINRVPFEQAIEKTQFDFDYYLTNRYTLKRYFDELKCSLYESS